MVIDKEEHKQLLIEIINQVQFPGNLLEIAFELKNAIKNAEVPNNYQEPVGIRTTGEGHAPLD